MKFDCDDTVYEFYKEYAHRIAFSVRKHFVKRAKMGQVKRRAFCCSKEGEQVFDKRHVNAAFRLPNSRVGCSAQITLMIMDQKYNCLKQYICEVKFEEVTVKVAKSL